MTRDTSQEDRCERPSRSDQERIRVAARTLRRPRTASWIANETDVSVKITQKVLDQLIEDSVLQKIGSNNQIHYCIDQLTALDREVATLQREYSYEELASTLESMQEQIKDWGEAYDVDTPSELRDSIATLESTNEIDQRREIASEWEQLIHRIPVVQAALNGYD